MRVKFPWVSRRDHEHALHYQAQQLAGLSLINHGNGVTNGMEAVLHWLTDSRAKANQIYGTNWASAPESFHMGWITGQEWINEAIKHLEQQIQDRKGGHAATHRPAEHAQGEGDGAGGPGESPGD